MPKGPLAAWRRYRARRFLEIGHGIGIDFATPTAGPVHLTVRFTEAGTTLDMEVRVLYARDSLKVGEVGRADVGIREIMKMLDFFCVRAADAGFLRLRAHGVRSGYKEGFRSFEVDLAHRLGRRARR